MINIHNKMEYRRTTATLLLFFLCSTDAAIEMTGPSTHTAMLGSDSQIPCTFTSDQPLTDSKRLIVTWYYDNKAILSSDGTVPDNPKYSVNMEQALHGTADLTIYNISMADSGNYKCAVSYGVSKDEKPINVNIQASPQITIVNNAVMTHKVSFLCCEISGFYPVDINITWFRDGEILDNVLEGKPRKNPNGTYSVNSSIILTPTEEDRGRNFSCRVEHMSLLRPLKKDFTLEYGGEKVPCTNECDKTATICLGCVCCGGLVLALIALGCCWKKNHRTAETQRSGDSTTARPNPRAGEPNVIPAEEIEMLPRRESSEESPRRRQRSSQSSTE